jgi:DNA-binding NarL/FixJ family response regulator
MMIALFTASIAGTTSVGVRRWAGYAEDDIEVIGEAADGEEAVAQTSALQPDVVLMDIRTPDERHRATRIIAGEAT